MATLEEVYEKVVSDEGEKKLLAQALAGGREGVAAFLAGRGCEAGPEEFAAFLKEKAPKPVEGELDDEELAGAAAGVNWKLVAESIGSFGLWCLIEASCA